MAEEAADGHVPARIETIRWESGPVSNGKFIVGRGRAEILALLRTL